jgi:hypothetical protein
MIADGIFFCKQLPDSFSNMKKYACGIEISGLMANLMV